MRLFVAVYPSPEAVADLLEQVGRLRVGAAAATGAKVRLVDPEHAHLTLAFLGEVPDAQLPDVEAALGAATTAHQAEVGAGTAYRLRLGGAGRFGRGRFTILWADVRGDVEILHALVGNVRAALHEAGLPYDEKPFRPHLTISRPGQQLDGAVVDEDVATLDGYLGPSWPLTSMMLICSGLGPQTHYTPLATWPLTLPA